MQLLRGLSFGVILTIIQCCVIVAAQEDYDAQIIIVGGGPAGIRAADALIKRNLTDFLILEDSHQLRGYMESIDFGGFTFVPAQLWACPPIVEDLELLNINYATTNYDSFVVRNDAGEDVTSDAQSRRTELFDAFDEGLDQVTDGIEDGTRQDISQKVTLARGGWQASSDIDKVLEWYRFDFLDGVSTRESSTIQSYLQREVFSGDYFIVDNNVTLADIILKQQEEGLTEEQVVFNQRAVTIDYTAEDSVKVVTEDGTEFTGEYAIITSTIGVLQSGDLTFDPPLPPWKSEEICRYQMRTIDPIFLKFDTKFWDDAEFILHASDRSGYYPVFFNLEAEGLYPTGTNILIGVLTGDEAYRAEHLTDEEVQAEVIEVLRGMYGAATVPDPTEFYMSRFATDPNLYGVLTTWPIGIIPEDTPRRLEGTVGRVYFVPEDASSHFIGIPCGSVVAGREAGGRVAECIEEGSCEDYSPIDPEEPPLCRDVTPYNPNKRRKNFNQN